MKSNDQTALDWFPAGWWMDWSPVCIGTRPLTGRAPAWPSSPWRSGWRTSRSTRCWAGSPLATACTPSPANPGSAPPRSGPPLPERSSAPPGWLCPPLAAGSGGRAGWLSWQAAPGPGAGKPQPKSGCRDTRGPRHSSALWSSSQEVSRDSLVHVVLPGVQLLPPHYTHGTVVRRGDVGGLGRRWRVLSPAGNRDAALKTVLYSGRHTSRHH